MISSRSWRIAASARGALTSHASSCARLLDASGAEIGAPETLECKERDGERQHRDGRTDHGETEEFGVVGDNRLPGEEAERDGILLLIGEHDQWEQEVVPDCHELEQEHRDQAR